MSKAVETNEPDTIEYQFYVNGSETNCFVHETYTNSEAAIAHNNGAASQTIPPRIFDISKITSFVYGNPSKELQKVLSNIGVWTNYNLFVGFSRH
jgi:uncharacterized protein (UPF0333 family)